VRSRRPRHSTVPAAKPARRVRTPLPPRHAQPPSPKRPAAPARAVARLIDESDTSLVDVIDNLLNHGVVLNADVILALANVDLVYLRLSALLCAADRVLPRLAAEKPGRPAARKGAGD
jgi:gas vesicle protein GvpA/GvpJ/GvpM family